MPVSNSDLESLDHGPADLVAIFNEWRDRRGSIERDPDLTVNERRRALADLAEAIRRRIGEAAQRLQRTAGRVEEEAERTEAIHPFRDPAEAARRWSRFERLLDARITLDQILARHVRDRADVAALEERWPTWLEASVASARPGAGASERSAAVASIGPRIAEGLAAIRQREAALLPEPLREDRAALERANVAASSIADHVDRIVGEVTGGRALTDQDMITLGLSDPTTVAAARASRTVPKPDRAAWHEPPASTWRLRKMAMDEAASGGQADPPTGGQGAGS